MDFFDDEQGSDDALLTNQTLIDTQERLGSLLDLMPTGLIIHQMQGILYANQQALHLLDQDKDRVVGKHILDFVPAELYDESNEMFMSAFMQDSPIRFPEVILRIPSSEKRTVRITAGRLPWEGTTVIQILLEDITELKRQAEELRLLTYNDALTGAYNRRFFMQNAETALQQAIQEDEEFSLIIFDIDWFKKINDTYGHLAGDETLKSITTIWNNCTRHTDHTKRKADNPLSRIGGEEFAIYFPGMCLETASAIAKRMRQTIEETEIVFEGQSIRFTASFGITQRRNGDRKIDDLIARSDLALYRAKENGRNRVECE